MEELKHFSHEQHPLILLKDSNNDKHLICDGCQKQTSSEPTYACWQCRIFLHKKCAELPREIHHPMHAQHPLNLLAKPPHGSGNCKCQACRKNWSNFIYHCSSCEFNIDILCAFLNRKIEHPSHNHPLLLIQRPISLECNACDEIRKDESYLCTDCPFWIHKTCGLLPDELKREDHDHHLSLAYFLPFQYRGYGFSCEICLKKLQPSFWLYYCGPCRYFYHIKCVTKKAPAPHIEDSSIMPRREYLKLPNKGIAVVPYYFTDLDKKGKHPPREFPKGIKVKSHRHRLVRCEVQKECNTNPEEILCDGCIEPIASLFYACGQCHFFLHIPCAQLSDLPINAANPGHYDCRGDQRFKLYLPENIWEVVKCDVCNSFCSGYAYKCEGCDFFSDAKCCFLKGRIEHKGHPHPLKQDSRWKGQMCSACGVSRCFLPFSCSACAFHVCHRCVMLPVTVKHRWDKHELVLSFPPFVDIPDQFYCEICEEEIHPKRWIYRCAECDQSFHPHCIPTLGASRNIKFGRTLAIQRHPHCLTLVPDGKFNRCDNCHKPLPWQRAFECEPCRFYLCPDCVAKEKLVD